MSNRPACIVYARPPAKRKSPSPSAAATPHRAAGVTSALLPGLTGEAALLAFRDLMTAWKMPPARGWRMLTGMGWQAGSLTPDQIVRVQHLVAIDSGLRTIGNVPGEWMMTTNPAAVLSGSAPVDYLARRETAGYATLLQQVQRWAAM